MRKIVIIDHEPYTTRRKELFLVSEFIELGYSVEVWDVSEYVFGIKYSSESIEYVKKIQNYNQLAELFEVQDCNNTVFWVECINNWDTRKIYNALSKYNCKTLRVDLFANSVLKESLVRKFTRLFSSSFYTIVESKAYSFLYLLYRKVNNIKGYDCYLSSSALAHRTGKINHPDYEKFLATLKEPPVINGDYFVFIDTYFPFHPDLISFYKCKNLPDGTRYHNSLRNYFDYIESKFKIPVVIAAHPKAKYNGNEFGTRKIIYGHTDNLVINSKCVIQHASNSISYVILRNIPVTFITTKDYESVNHLSSRLKLLASLLGHSVYNIDLVKYDEIKFTSSSDDIVTDYIYTYLTSIETKDKYNFDIIRQTIDDLFCKK